MKIAGGRMSVSDLIKELQKCNPETPVTIDGYDTFVVYDDKKVVSIEVEDEDDEDVD